MLEMLVAVALSVIVFTTLATVAAQWMPNWNRGMAQVQQMERLGVGIDRIVKDIAAAEFVTVGSTLAFQGAPDSVTFVRSGIGPSARPGLEFVRLTQRNGERGPSLVRERARYLPAAAAEPQFSDPVTLVPSPYTIGFAYAGTGQGWSPEWRDGLTLPRLVRVTVRENVTGRVVVASTVTVIAVDTPAECVRVKNIAQCLAGRRELNEREL